MAIGAEKLEELHQIVIAIQTDFGLVMSESLRKLGGLLELQNELDDDNADDVMNAVRSDLSAAAEQLIIELEP